MRLKILSSIIVLSCCHLFSCRKIENSNTITKSSEIRNGRDLSQESNQSIASDIYSRTKLTNADLSLIQSKIGHIDTKSFQIKVYSDSISIYYALIQPPKSSISINNELMITDKFSKNNHILNAYIGVVESFDKNINVSTNTNNITNGQTIIYNLNTGEIIGSKIQAGVDKGVTITSSTFKLSNPAYTADKKFTSCFSDCVVDFVSDLSWLERALCLIDIEECLPGITIGCTANCIVS